MTLLALLFALALERVVLPSPKWQFATYVESLFDTLKKNRTTQGWFDAPIGMVAIAAIPALIVWLVLEVVEGALFGLLSLVVTVLVITVAMGCLQARKAYKQFLRAARREDEQACYMVAKELGALSDSEPSAQHSQSPLPKDVELAAELLDDDEPLEQPEQSPQVNLEQGVGQTLAWVNYRYYIAVMIWLVIFGPVGVAFYATLRTLADQERSQVAAPEQDIDTDALQVDDDGEVSGLEQQLDELTEQPQSTVASELLRWLDFIPVRLASLGLTLVGNFGKAMPVWLEHLVNTEESPKAHLVRVSLAAEEIADPHNPTCVVSVGKFVEIAKRNVLLVLSVVAILTLYGSVS
ncbi:regulatory signaling modulator protein AmpE [Neiella sp. HB171785]|uniref:Regulatory signaling modulator protein AmpE n=1 Tax=Neiella litorisoli TaxID=2771431 RepID=A0A8J6QJ84_9GAMM|nr:regulatory signaling modulator protein AmpE [Neiella litorisoli]MBD1389978.1 regulatory signaling modulator protein AmpE [Neiella litorisoli]